MIYVAFVWDTFDHRYDCLRIGMISTDVNKVKDFITANSEYSLGRTHDGEEFPSFYEWTDET